MTELRKKKSKVVNAIVDKKPEYVRIADWDGKSLSFILADEIRLEEKPAFPNKQIDKR
jgi:hypothetical protein